MFTPIPTLTGTVLLSLSSTTLLFSTGRTLGCSTILSDPLSPKNGPILTGLLLSSVLARIFFPSFLPSFPTPVTPFIPGLLVGFGTRLSNGCTSGHMLCGIPRGNIRSFAATGVFFSTAVGIANHFDTAPYCVGQACHIAAPISSTTITGLGALVAAAGAGAVVVYRLRDPLVARVYAGLVFGAGLIASGMARPGKTLGFMAMDTQKWDPSLLIVAVVGLGGNAVLWWGRIGTGKVWCEDAGERWCISTSGKVDWKLIVGAAFFGAGWGLGGICPGPGVIGIVANGLKGLEWAGGFMAGSILARMVQRWQC